MSKKPAPPGKRGSVKREAFKVDEDGDDLPTSTTGSVAAPVVAASPAVLGPNDEEIKRRQEAERRMERERQERLQYERDRLAEEEEHRRQAHAAQSISDDVKRQREMAAAAEAEREREALRAADVAARERAQKEELERRRREMLQQQQQQQREEEEEEARKQAEIAAAAAAARERAEKQQQEIERAQADLAARHLAEKEELRLLKVQQQELQRQQADQLRARQEQEEEKRRQQQEAVDRERSRLIEEARRARDEAEARQRAEDEAEEAELRRQAEIERESVKAAKLAETQRLKDEEEAEIAEALKRAEEQRRKRQMFLSDMDSFSTQFVSQTQEKETALEDAQRKQDTLRANLAAIPVAPVDQPRVRSNHRVIDDADDDLRPLTIVEEPIPASPPPVKHHLQSGTTRNILVDASAVQSRQQNLAQLTNALFTDNDADSSEGAATPVATGPTIAAVIESTTVDGEELRMPTRIGGGDKAYRTKTTATAAAASSTAVAGTAAASSVSAGSRALAHHSSAGASASAVGGDEDDEEEGTGQLDSISNILTREERRTMTREEKANWRAKQVDLNTRRKDFHGAVTYMFDGIFSWQMYGSAEALDEFGNTYTEYLMRCQWGTSFENLQPWIVAHRYREFDKLDQDLKKRFPALENTMPRLPKKEFFWSMETQVVTKRRQALEDYMVKLVQSYPTLLRSDLMDVFLHIAERIKSIKMLLKVAPSLNMTKASSSSSMSASAGGSAAGSSSSSQPPSSQSQQPPQRAEDVYEAAAESAGILASVPMDGSDPLGVGQPVTTKRGGSSTVRGGGGPVVVDDDEASRASKPNASTKILYWTMDEADRAKDETHCRPLDEDGLGCVEEDIRNLYMMMKKTPAKEIVQRDSHVRRQLARINHRWPALRATSVVNMDVDFILIPRAMQAEEDYVRALNEFRNLDMLQGYNV